MGLIRFLIFTIAILWLLKLVVRILLPVLFQKMVNNVQNQSNQRYQQQRPDGKIKIDYIPPRPKDEKLNKAGDFVEYEEVS
jgi:hypothetical protein